MFSAQYLVIKYATKNFENRLTKTKIMSKKHFE